MMRILLLEHPREASEAHFNDIANTPLWSCLMTGYAGASLVRAGFEADIVDAARWTSAQTVQRLVDHPSPDVLADSRSLLLGGDRVPFPDAFRSA